MERKATCGANASKTRLLTHFAALHPGYDCGVTNAAADHMGEAKLNEGNNAEDRPPDFSALIWATLASKRGPTAAPQDEVVLHPHGEERGEAARLEP
jgi:hypothetical protein